MVTVNVAGKDVCTSSTTSGYPEWDPDHTFLSMNFPEGCDVVPGDPVRMTDGSLTITHTVQNLAVTGVDELGDTVSGTADPFAEIHAWPHTTGEEVVIAADGDGNWIADFSDIFDLIPNECGRAEIRDEAGNGTAVDWCVPDPHFTVYLEWQFIEGWEWPVGSLVTLTIDDPATGEASDHEMQGVVEPSDGGPNASTVGFDLTGLYVVKPGDVVTLSDESISRTHVVRNLTVTSADASSNLVRGTADPGATISVFPHDSGDAWQLVTADAAGQWQVDFSDSYDLLPGNTGAALIVDENGNATEVGWNAVQPRVLVNIGDDWMFPQDFPANSDISFTIYDSPGGSLLWGPEVKVTNEAGESFLNASEHGLDLVPGNYIAVTAAGVTKDLTLEAITFDILDLASGHMSGTAPSPSGRAVWVGVRLPDDSFWGELVSTDADGNWSAEFGGPIPQDYKAAGAHIFDSDRDATEANPSQVLGVAELWLASFTHDLPGGTWAEGTHSYFYDSAYTYPEPGDTAVTEPVVFDVSLEAPLYEGYVLLRPFNVQARIGGVCEPVTVIHPDQPTRFLFGWLTDWPLTPDEAVAHFDSMTVHAVSEGIAGSPWPLGRHEILEADETDWSSYSCAFALP
jgi:hypothetical protein